ncbi:MAG: hypothetical protein LBI69_00370 [Puniceicoccales bacterium]|nr:hypothetical protein [Puniceicoccales bacterium]
MRSKVRNFKAFNEGIHGIFLRSFFPKMPSYTAFLKQLKKQSGNLLSLATDGYRSTPLTNQLQVKGIKLLPKHFPCYPYRWRDFDALKNKFYVKIGKIILFTNI